MGLFSKNIRHTLKMRAFGLTQIPLLFLCSPRVISLTNQRCEVLIPLRKIVKNHLGSLYFGALAVGADTCVGLLAFEKIKQSQANIHLIFKDFKATFLKRAEGDTLFVCEEGESIQNLIDDVVRTKERAHKTIAVKAYVRNEVVAEFELTLSLKVK